MFLNGVGVDQGLTAATIRVFGQPSDSVSIYSLQISPGQSSLFCFPIYWAPPSFSKSASFLWPLTVPVKGGWILHVWFCKINLVPFLFKSLKILKSRKFQNQTFSSKLYLTKKNPPSVFNNSSIQIPTSCIVTSPHPTLQNMYIIKFKGISIA